MSLEGGSASWTGAGTWTGAAEKTICVDFFDPQVNIHYLESQSRSLLDYILIPVLGRIVKFDRIPNTEYIRFLKND